MPEPDRRARLDELASDLWEHVHHAAASGRRRGAVQLEIAARAARGAGSDLAWRCSRRSRPVAVTALRLLAWAAFACSTALLVTFTAWSAAPVLGVYAVEDWAPGDAREFARVNAALFGGLAGGLALLRHRPRAGTTLVAAACAGMSLYLLWAWPFLVPCSAACIAGTAALARRTA
jgi:hypothetical protein